MNGLLTLLLFAGFFYVMMRYGCGAHMVHGHGGHASHDGHTPTEEQRTDPVCGMPVPVGQGYSEMHAGRQYRFCSRACLDKFDVAPDQYLPVSGGV